MFLGLLKDFFGWKDTLTWLLKMHKTILFELTVVWKRLFSKYEQSNLIAVFWKYFIRHQSYHEGTPSMHSVFESSVKASFQSILDFFVFSCQRFWKPVFVNLCTVVPEPLWLLWCRAPHLPSSVSQEHQTSLLAMLRMKQPQLVWRKLYYHYHNYHAYHNYHYHHH